ncbi:anti-anti-sigma factor [Thermocatellispora tengchongensis]|uniref:Anti-anti-sigma factor n=1 Tax=Thermocatellispora tengchongensis TaxID=1073253 RepID=A0A840P1Y1_9ACTN|nr:STAS domain-containing protein [Thermocatellispora tengchongensis]MBB5131470.1 anti-anti-sigma factor [Thermocatellispora tengchongensis]
MLLDDGQLRVTRSAGGTLTLHGEVDARNSAVLAGVLIAARTPPGTPLVVDLQGLTFIDMSGLRVLRPGPGRPGLAPVRLVNVPRLMRRLLDMLPCETAS